MTMTEENEYANGLCLCSFLLVSAAGRAALVRGICQEVVRIMWWNYYLSIPNMRLAN
jgi:hypothetical protein